MRWLADALMLLGFSGVVAGAALIYVPAALIIGGAFLFWLGYPGPAKKEGKPK